MLNKILVSILIFASCVDIHACTLKDFEWLWGNWKSVSKNTTSYENWHKVSHLTAEGMGSVINADGTTRSEESMRLVEMNGDIFLIAKVYHNDFPVPFKMVACESKSVEFRNMKHDFPNILHYQLKIDERLMVDVTNGEGQGFSVTYEKH